MHDDQLEKLSYMRKELNAAVMVHIGIAIPDQSFKSRDSGLELC